MKKSKEITDILKSQNQLDFKKRSVLADKISEIKGNSSFQSLIQHLEITDQEYRANFGIIFEAYKSFLESKNDQDRVELIREEDGELHVSLKPHLTSVKSNQGYVFQEFPDEWLEATPIALDNIRKENGPRLKLSRLFYKYRNNDDRSWLYVHGSINTGKSYSIVAFLNSYLEVKKESKVAYIDYPDFTQYITKTMFDKESGNLVGELFASLQNLDILVLDNFAQGNNSNYVRDTILLPILETRARNNLLTIFISRFSLNDALQMYSGSTQQDKIKNRLLEELLRSKVSRDYQVDFGSIGIY